MFIRSCSSSIAAISRPDASPSGTGGCPGLSGCWSSTVWSNSSATACLIVAAAVLTTFGEPLFWQYSRKQMDSTWPAPSCNQFGGKRAAAAAAATVTRLQRNCLPACFHGSSHAQRLLLHLHCQGKAGFGRTLSSTLRGFCRCVSAVCRILSFTVSSELFSTCTHAHAHGHAACNTKCGGAAECASIQAHRSCAAVYRHSMEHSNLGGAVAA